LLFCDPPGLQEAFRHHEYSPGRAVSKNAADFAPKRCGTIPELRPESSRKRSQAFVTDRETDFRGSSSGSQHLLCLIHAQASRESVRRLTEGGAEEPVKMKFGKTSFLRCSRQQNSAIELRRKQMASPAKSTEGIVMQKHAKMIHRLAGRSSHDKDKKGASTRTCKKRRAQSKVMEMIHSEQQQAAASAGVA
jgi:hypothetical protein